MFVLMCFMFSSLSYYILALEKDSGQNVSQLTIFYKLTLVDKIWDGSGIPQFVSKGKDCGKCIKKELICSKQNPTV